MIAHYPVEDYTLARQAAERWQRAYPSLTFVPVTCQSQAGWTVAIMVGRDIVGYCPQNLPKRGTPLSVG